GRCSDQLTSIFNGKLRNLTPDE
ncbi:unnamed protein product, partial [Allacma fusca]